MVNINDNLNSIPEFFAGQTIFITGGTGFMGKVLVEKLLRCCPDVEKIYLLARPKRNRSIQERWSEMTQLPLFDNLRSTNPDSFKKIQMVAGNIDEKDLGISNDDLKILTANVTIVYHAAAMIQFTENLYSVLVTNTRSTYFLLNIAKSMKKLQLFVYVSTAFSNMNLPCEQAEERVIPACQDWRVILHLLENDSVGLASLKEKLMCGHPIPYTWSKSLSEQIVNEYSQWFPTQIIRPSIVCPTYKEPFQAWADILCGICAIGIPVGLGLLRVFYMAPGSYQDFIPCDTAINAMLVATYAKCLNTNKEETDVYNCGVVKEIPLNNSYLAEHGSKVFERYPSKNAFWVYHVIATNNLFLYSLLFALLQVLPAAIVDSILFLTGRKPKLMNLTKKMFKMSKSVRKITSSQVAFPNDKFKQLENFVCEKDKEKFSMRLDGLTPLVCMDVGYRSALQYVLKEDISEESLKKNRRRFFWIQVADKCLVYTFYAAVAYLLARYAVSIEFLRNTSFFIYKKLLLAS